MILERQIQRQLLTADLSERGVAALWVRENNKPGATSRIIIMIKINLMSKLFKKSDCRWQSYIHDGIFILINSTT